MHNVYYKNVRLQSLLSLVVKDRRQFNTNKFILVKKENANITCFVANIFPVEFWACRFAGVLFAKFKPRKWRLILEYCNLAGDNYFVLLLFRAQLFPLMLSCKLISMMEWCHNQTIKVNGKHIHDEEWLSNRVYNCIFCTLAFYNHHC